MTGHLTLRDALNGAQRALERATWGEDAEARAELDSAAAGLRDALRDGVGLPQCRRAAKRLRGLLGAIHAALDGEVGGGVSHSGSIRPFVGPTSASAGLQHAATPRELSKKTA